MFIPTYQKFKYFIFTFVLKSILLQFQHINELYRTCTYKLLPEDEPSYSKHVEDVLKSKYYFNNLQFVGLYYTTALTLWCRNFL